MYKTKVNTICFDCFCPAGEQLKLGPNGGSYLSDVHSSLSFSKSFVESHPEFFEKVEEKSLEEKVLSDYPSMEINGCEYYTEDIVIEAMQEYHKLAGGFSEDDMIDFWRYDIDLNKDKLIEVISRRTAVKALALYKRGIK